VVYFNFSDSETAARVSALSDVAYLTVVFAFNSEPQRRIRLLSSLPPANTKIG